MPKNRLIGFSDELLITFPCYIDDFPSNNSRIFYSRFGMKKYPKRGIKKENLSFLSIFSWRDQMSVSECTDS